MKNKTNIMLVSLILSVMLLSPMISARDSSSELVKGWNIVEFSEDIAWVDLRFSDGEVILNITEAGDAGWIASSLKYWGYDEDLEDYEFLYVDESGNFGKTFISANKQVLAYSNQDGISIVVDKPNNVKVKPYNPEKKNKKLFEED